MAKTLLHSMMTYINYGPCFLPFFKRFQAISGVCVFAPFYFLQAYLLLKEAKSANFRVQFHALKPHFYTPRKHRPFYTKYFVFLNLQAQIYMQIFCKNLQTIFCLHCKKFNKIFCARAKKFAQIFCAARENLRCKCSFRARK